MADPIITRELTSLRDEMAANQRSRISPAGAAATSAAPTQTGSPAAEEPANQTGLEDESPIHDLVGELVDEVSSFLEEAEKNIAAHPAASVIGALVVGIIIGSMIRRR
jgi:hypothetical protein